MLVIRNSQLEVFREQMRQRFIEKMVSHARQSYAALCQPHDDAELASLMTQCLERAARYQFFTEAQVIEFLDLLLTFGVNVDTEARYERITRVLQSEHGNGRSPTFRLDEVSKTLHRIARRHPEIVLTQLALPSGNPS